MDSDKSNNRKRMVELDWESLRSMAKNR